MSKRHMSDVMILITLTLG